MPEESPFPFRTPMIPPPYPYYDDTNYVSSSRSRQNILNIMLNELELELDSNTDTNVTETNTNANSTLERTELRASCTLVDSTILEPDELTSTVSRNWEYVNVSLTRVPGYGFGIAVSGGCDNPHFANGDPAIAISDVLKGGPAQGKLQINDRIISANGISLDNVDYSTAVADPAKRIKKLNFESLGFTISVTLQIKTVDSPALGLREGDIIDKIQGLRVNELFNEKIVVKELKRVVDESSNGNSGTLNLTVKRSGSHRTAQPQQAQTPQPTLSTGNLYVQPPTRNNKSFDNTNVNTPPPPPPPRPPLPVEFEAKNQLGIRLSGGNKTGIIVSAVQKNSQAELQGLSNHDKIIRVNEHDFMQNPPTRENAIEILSSIPNDTLVNLTVERSAPIPLHINQDEFYIRTRFQSDDFKIHELLLVTDTLVNGMVGHWEAYRVDSNGNALKHEKLIIPNVKHARDMLKKSWKRTTSFRNREYEDLLACSIAVDPYDNIEKILTHDLSKRPLIMFTPHNPSVVDSLSNLKNSSRVFKFIKSNDRLEFTDQRVRVIQDYVSVKYVQELHEKRIYPIVMVCNFPNKETMKDAIRDASKYSKSKKMFNVMGKLDGKLGSYADLKHEASDFESMAQWIYRVVVERGDAVSTVFAKVNDSVSFTNMQSNVALESNEEFNASSPLV
ncbi:Tight junction protein ZO-1 [Orchesella cincta]|uniref:Tight junction protein ZO-1 n=1 Tax=Orchesella cincta TaxID=48709 RepID=A0A1D2MM34_ORCCI|nr:Tight junction protein ZO-1 [Orchesella cincta]